MKIISLRIAGDTCADGRMTVQIEGIMGDGPGHSWSQTDTITIPVDAYHTTEAVVWRAIQEISQHYPCA